MLKTKGIYYKMLFDGLDFMETEVGSILIPEKIKPLIKKITYSKIYENVDKFLEYCKPSNYMGGLSKKYNVRLYNTQMAFDKENPWYDKEYILFNRKYIKDIDLDFHVCPAYDKGVCGLGFRIVEPEKVDKSFKWLFMQGNNIIYGKDTVDKEKECYIVEGFRDYVALKESGYNVIALGSVRISKLQEEYINTLKQPILLLDNDSFGLQQLLSYKEKYRIATLKTTEKDAWDTYNKGKKIEIMEIK